MNDPTIEAYMDRPMVTYCDVHYAIAAADETCRSPLCLGTDAECQLCHPPEGQSSCPICGRPDMHTSCDQWLVPATPAPNPDLTRWLTRVLFDDVSRGTTPAQHTIAANRNIPLLAMNFVQAYEALRTALQWASEDSGIPSYLDDQEYVVDEVDEAMRNYVHWWTWGN